MPGFTFLHLADIHLDTTFLSRDASVRAQLRDDIRTAFLNGVDTAIDNRLHAVLIAGDLFDGERLSLSTERFLVEAIKRLDEAGITTVYTTGNHDHAGILRRRMDISWPASFHVIDRSTPVTVDIRSESGVACARIVGCGHDAPDVGDNLAAVFPPAAGSVPTVGLLHTMVTGAGGVEDHDRYAPCSVEDLSRPGYD